MKTSLENKAPRRQLADWILISFIAFCAMGAGITGTLLWMENRAEPPAPTAATQDAAAPKPVKNPLLDPMLSAQMPNANTPQTNAPNAQAPNAPFADALPQTAPDASALGTAMPNSGAPSDGAPNADAHQHGPPPSTAGMRPVQAALLMANWHYDVAHWNEAIKKYQETISLGLDNADVRTDLGNCYRFSSQPQKALEQYSIAQKQNPKHENSLFNQGGLFASDLNQPARGVQIWKEYLKRFPKGQNVARVNQLLARYDK